MFCCYKNVIIYLGLCKRYKTLCFVQTTKQLEFCEENAECYKRNKEEVKRMPLPSGENLQKELDEVRIWWGGNKWGSGEGEISGGLNLVRDSRMGGILWDGELTRSVICDLICFSFLYPEREARGALLYRNLSNSFACTLHCKGRSFVSQLI